MTSKSQRQLKEIIGKTSRELIATKMGVSSRTIERWTSGDSKPAYAARKLISQIYNGYKSQRGKDEQAT